MSSLADRLLRPQTISNIALIVLLVGLVSYFGSKSSVFLTSSNIVVLLSNAAALGVMVVPFTILVISGNIDFSIGSTAALTATVTAISVTQWGLSEVTGIVLGLLLAAVVGVVNGFLCVVLGFNPIIVTLGMLGALRGATLLVQQDQIYGVGPLVESIGTGSFLGIPYTLWIALIAFVAGGLFLSCAPAGRHVLAIGANPQAAYLSALPVKLLPFVLYVATSVGAGLAGIVFLARLNGVSPGGTADGLEFQALTIVLLGGVAFAGGRGSLLGVAVAWVFIAALQNGLVLIHVTPYVQTVVGGLALVVAAALDRVGTTLLPRINARRYARRVERSRAASDGPDPISAERAPVGVE